MRMCVGLYACSKEESSTKALWERVSGSKFLFAVSVLDGCSSVSLISVRDCCLVVVNVRNAEDGRRDCSFTSVSAS